MRDTDDVRGRERDALARSPFVTGSAQADARGVVRQIADLTRGRDSLQQLPAFAAQLLGTSSAHFAYLSDVQEVQGGVGLSAGLIGLETPPEESMCSVTVASEGVTAISDATEDPRVAGMAPVTGGLVRSYLGVPLQVRGLVVGALCVFDAEPRTWDPADIELLKGLAAPIMAEFELAALAIEFQSERLLWQHAVDAAGVGAFDWMLETDELRWDDRLLEIFGLEADTFGGNIGAFNEAVHPDDRAMVADALQTAIATCGIYAAEYRIHRPDGSLRWISARGRALAGPDGTATRVLGAAYDTTATVEGEATVRRVLEAMPAAFFHLDHEWRFVFLNTNAANLLGAIGAEITGAVIWELFPAAVGSEFERHYRDAVESRQPVQFEAYYPPPLDCWYDVRAWPTPDGLSVYFVDATERREAQALLELGRERAELLANISEALTGTLHPEAAAAELARLVVGPLADWSIVSLIDHPSASVRPEPADDRPSGWRRGLRDVAGWHRDPSTRDLVQRYVRERVDGLTESSPVAQAIRHDRPVVLADPAREVIAPMVVPGEARKVLNELGPTSAAVLPLRARGRTLGLLSVYRESSGSVFSESDLEVLADIAVRAGLALDNARLYADQRDLAEGLQRSLLTEPPDPSDLELAVRYVPAAEVAQVGGDWYDAFTGDDGETVIAIGDVVGHDTASAAAMGQLRALLRGISVTTAAGPAEVLSRLDQAMRTLRLETTATAITARFAHPEPGRVRMVWANAGHPPPLVALAAGANPDLSGSEVLLGVEPESARHDRTVDLPPGSVVLFYTDGLVERRSLAIDVGIAALEQRFDRLARSVVGLEEMCDELLRELLPPSAEDDVALVAVRVRPVAD